MMRAKGSPVGENLAKDFDGCKMFHVKQACEYFSERCSKTCDTGMFHVEQCREFTPPGAPEDLEMFHVERETSLDRFSWRWTALFFFRPKGIFAGTAGLESPRPTPTRVPFAPHPSRRQSTKRPVSPRCALNRPKPRGKRIPREPSSRLHRAVPPLRKVPRSGSQSLSHGPVRARE